MRPYIDDFTQDLQDAFETKIEEIIMSGGNDIVTSIVNLLFIDWDIALDTPVCMTEIVRALYRYLYTPADPFVVRSGAKASEVLQLCIKKGLPHLLSDCSEAA